MFPSDDVRLTCPANQSEAEWLTRVQLAACYRVFDRRGWVEEIFNHSTVRVPGPEHHYLINPFGLHNGEVTAHNLVKVDASGEVQGDSPYVVNRAGFVIHSAIHQARADAHCVIRTYHTAGVAVACKADAWRWTTSMPSSCMAASLTMTSKGSPCMRASSLDWWPTWATSRC